MSFILESHPVVLDTTLRDGSYAVNFKFTSTDVTHICTTLEECGINAIEIGHGLGLGAWRRNIGEPSLNDEEFLVAARSAIKHAKFGMFCIPGIAELADLELVKKYGGSFVRIGCDVTKAAESEEFIQKARNLGLFVCSNFMKSYVLSPTEFAALSKRAVSFGTNLVYIVDSAGAMFPSDIEQYYLAVRKETDVLLGFHGHDNLCLANANSLKAAQLGFSLLDGSLQGLGRSSGNARTEVVALLLQKAGISSTIDAVRLVQDSERLFRTLGYKCDSSFLDTLAGFAEFHSSYLKHIREYSERYKINPALLLLEASKHDKINVNLQHLESTSKSLADMSNCNKNEVSLPLNQYCIDEETIIIGNPKTN